MEEQSFATRTEAINFFRNNPGKVVEVGDVRIIQFHDVADTSNQTIPIPGVISVVELQGIGRYALVWTHQQLVEFAKEVLRRYEPTTGDRILASLERVEVLLTQSDGEKL